MREASAGNVDVYVTSVRNQLRSTLQEVQAQLTVVVSPLGILVTGRIKIAVCQ